MERCYPNTEQLLLRISKPMLDALVRRAAELTLERNERMTVQSLLREIVGIHLKLSEPGIVDRQASVS